MDGKATSGALCSVLVTTSLKGYNGTRKSAEESNQNDY